MPGAGDQIRDYEEAVEAMRLPMGVICDEFVGAAATALAAFWPPYIDECIAANGPRLEAMSEHAVTALKREVEQVAADPSRACRREIVERETDRWPHLVGLEELIESVHGPEARGLGYGAFSPDGDSPPAALWFGVDLAAGAVAVPFHAAGLVAPLANIDEEGCRVAYGQRWPAAMIDASERYARHAFQVEEARYDREESGTAGTGRRRPYSPIVLPRIFFMNGEDGAEGHAESSEGKDSLQLSLFGDEIDDRP